MKVTVNISKDYYNSLLPKIEDIQYFRLDNKSTTRKDLFNFAFSLGVRRGYAKELESSNSLYRTENLNGTNDLFLYASAYYDNKVSNGKGVVEDLTDHDSIIELAEEFANTGFGILKEKVETTIDENFMYEILEDCDKMYEEINDTIDRSI